ncbi:MAG TPA: radical SAM protein [Alphaproteobacteria bacterium]|nr:radical SAM protein [Alphaproteobacteria bacterium]
MSGRSGLELLLVNPGSRAKTYQQLGEELTAVEPPLWCRLLAGYVRDRGHSVAIVDAEAEELEPAAVAARVAEARPRLVAVVAFGHQPSASTQQMAAAGPVCRAIKEDNPAQAVIILGGHVAALPERTLREEAVDFACNGEGPVTLSELLAVLRGGKPHDFSKVQGLVYREDGAVRTNPSAALIVELDKDLHGKAWDLLPIEKYRAHNWQCFGDLAARKPYASIYTSLGCPYKCNFCCINAPFGVNRYRMRAPAAVAAEIDLLHAKYGVKTYKIVDEMFVLNERHVLGLCDLLIERNYDLNIWAYARVDTVKPRMLEKLRRAGVRWLALGIESGSEHVRDGAEKSFSEADIIAVVRQIQAAGINVIGNFIFGLPDDDLETMQQTLALAQELNCEFVNFYSAMAYPGSLLYRAALAKGWALPEEWSGFSQHSYDCLPLRTEKLSAAAVLEFRDRAFSAYFASPRYLDMVGRKFGPEARAHVVAMARHKLRRRLLEAAAPAAAAHAIEPAA